MRQVSFAVVGADHPNTRGPGRRFEIAVCAPGDPIFLEHEPKNRFDQNAIKIVSERGVQLGYVAAEKTSLIHRAWRDGNFPAAIFQRATSFGAWIRVDLDGDEPALPLPYDEPDSQDNDSGFWPDYIPPDE